MRNWIIVWVDHIGYPIVLGYCEAHTMCSSDTIGEILKRRIRGNRGIEWSAIRFYGKVSDLPYPIFMLGEDQEIRFAADAGDYVSIKINHM